MAAVKFQRKVLRKCDEKREDNSPVSVLLKLSKISSNCFCLRGTIKPENAFGPWGSEQDALDIDSKSGHICTGGFIIDYLKQQKNAAQKPATTKKTVKPLKNFFQHIGYVPTVRQSKQSNSSRNITAFNHLSSYEEYADYYRMSKSQHYCDPVLEKQQANTPPASSVWTMQNMM